MIAAAHYRVKSWMEGQSVLWMENAMKLYAAHEESKIKKSSASPFVPKIFTKQIPKNKKKQDIVPI